jgi:hypothetical protein
VFIEAGGPQSLDNSIIDCLMLCNTQRWLPIEKYNPEAIGPFNGAGERIADDETPFLGVSGLIPEHFNELLCI